MSMVVCCLPYRAKQKLHQSLDLRVVYTASQFVRSQCVLLIYYTEEHHLVPWYSSLHLLGLCVLLSVYGSNLCSSSTCCDPFGL